MKTCNMILAFILALCSFTLEAQEQKEWKVLFVGNSYTYGYNLPHIVSIISEGTALHILNTKSTAGGAQLRQHWLGLRDLETKSLIAGGDFDAVVLQDHSMSALNHPDTTLKYIELFAAFNEKHGALTFLYNTWPRERVPQYATEINAMYRQAAEESGATRIPVGEAWELAMDLRPMVDLYTSDGSHPNELGTLLTATTMVRVMCGELPDLMPTLYRVPDARGELVRLMNHNPEDVEFCRRIVEELLAGAR